MGHESTANMLLAAGADNDPAKSLFDNIWDSDELNKLVNNYEKYSRTLELNRDPFALALVFRMAAFQFKNMGQESSVGEMNRRALEEVKHRDKKIEHRRKKEFEHYVKKILGDKI